MFNKLCAVTVLIFITIGWFLFTYRILDVPPGINGDEAAIGYNAALVARTGYDQSDHFLPLFVSAFDLTDWKQPVTFYSTVLAFKIFKPTFVILREVSVVFVLVSAVLIFFLSKEILGIKGAFVGLIIFLTIPAVLIQSHLALENIAPVPFTILWLLMLLKYKKTLSSKYIFISAIVLGISLFSYPGMRLIFPIFTGLTVALIYYLNRKKKVMKIVTENLKFLLIISSFPILMYSVKDQYPGAILAYNRPHDIKSYQELILPYISSFDPSFLFIQGDSTPYHSTGKQGVFLLATIPIFALGIFRIAQKKNPMLIFILLVFFLTPLLYGLAASIHRGSRLLVLLPPYTIITSLGFLSLYNIKNSFVKFLLISIAIFVISVNYIDFVRDYWYEYPNRVKSEFAKPIHKAFEKTKEISLKDNLTPFIQNDLYLQNPIAADFFGVVYFQNKLQKWMVNQDLPKGSIVIVNPSDATSGILGRVKLEKIEGVDYALLINEK